MASALPKTSVLNVQALPGGRNKVQAPILLECMGCGTNDVGCSNSLAESVQSLWGYERRYRL